MPRSTGNFIQKAVGKHKGKLHAKLGVPAGKPIPVPLLRKSAKAKGQLGKEARLALTLRSFQKKKKTKTT